MIKLLIESFIRNKSSILKINVVSIIINTLPLVVYINEYNSSYSNELLVKSVVYSLMVITIFEMIFFSMNFFKYNKLNDLILSGYSIFKFVFNYATALYIVFLPSAALKIIIYSLLFLIVPSPYILIKAIALTYLLVCCVSLLLFGMHIKFENIFHKINTSMDVIYILSGVNYPIVVMPTIFVLLAAFNPFSYVSRYVDEGQLNIAFFLIIISLLIVSVILIRGVESSERND